MGNSQTVIEAMGAEEVAAYIVAIGAAYGPYRDDIIDNGLDGELVLSFLNNTEEEQQEALSSVLNITNIVHRKRLLSELARLKKRLSDTANVLLPPTPPIGEKDFKAEEGEEESQLLRSLSFNTTASLSCNICLGPLYRPVTIICGHNFCKGCIETWFASHNTCPNCVAPVSPENRRNLHVNTALRDFVDKAYPKESVARERERREREEGERREREEGKRGEREQGDRRARERNQCFITNMSEWSCYARRIPWSCTERLQ
jgi:hypothetical protein